MSHHLLPAEEKTEIIYNLINCGLAGLLVFMGAFTTGNITTNSLITAGIAAAITFIAQFKDYWSKETKLKTNRRAQAKLFSFF